MRTIFLTAIVICLAPLHRGEARNQQETFLSSYVSTLRNLKTQGAILAYRIWLTADEEARGFTLLYPRPLTLGFEARFGWLWEPDDTGEGSILVDLKYELDLHDDIGFYLLGGVGGNYSGVDYTNVATRFNFVSRASFGVRIWKIILQTSYEHRSNAGLWAPNRGVDLVTASLGIRF